jgi:transglutaminase-like putative cysteine protease
MIELSELMRLEKINAYFKEIGRHKEMILTLNPNVPGLIRTFRSEQKLEKRRFHLEYKLTPEQIVVAITKAEKEAKAYIVEYQQKSSLRGWVTSMFKWSAEETKVQGDPNDVEF